MGLLHGRFFQERLERASLARFLAQQMPEGEAVPDCERTWVSLLITGQIAAGVILGFVVQGVIIWIAFNYLRPAVGLEFFDLAGEFASENLPGKAIAFFAGKS